MTISAKVICHSISSAGGPALVTVKAKYPRYVHSELMTHRMFSRNASSSRAIPVARLIQDVLDDPAVPIHWGMNEKGMQATQECFETVSFEHEGEQVECDRRNAWLFARDNAVTMARAFDAAGYHKQIVNRLLEPFCHITTLISSTNWSNFFALRCHPAAQPEMRMLATQIRNVIAASEPTMLAPDEWHLPFVVQDDYDEAPWFGKTVKDETTEQAWQWLIKLSVARCARVSYETHEGKVPSVEQDLALYDRLVGSEPLHASPAEHQATPWNPVRSDSNIHGGNFGWDWIQYRKTLPNECL